MDSCTRRAISANRRIFLSVVIFSFWTIPSYQLKGHCLMGFGYILVKTKNIITKVHFLKHEIATRVSKRKYKAISAYRKKTKLHRLLVIFPIHTERT